MNEMYLTLANAAHLKSTPCTTYIVVAVLKGFANEDEMMKNIREVCTDLVCDVIGGVSFTNLPPGGASLPKNVKYKIRTHSDGEISFTYAVIPFLKYPSPRAWEKRGKRVN